MTKERIHDLQMAAMPYRTARMAERKRLKEIGGPVAAIATPSGITFGGILAFVAPIIGAILRLVSPELRKLIGESLQTWYNKAKQTPSPWDNFLVTFIADTLGVSLKE